MITGSASLEELKKAYAKIDPYEPLYGVDDTAAVLRKTKDRCQAIYSYLSNDVSNLRILDVGCNAGYVSFYLADRGADVSGWDYLPENIEVCENLKAINDIGVDFELKKFGLETIAEIEPGQFDVVFILSVLHWTINEEGLEYVQECMKQLLAKVPKVIVELAQKDEIDIDIYKVAPSNDLAIFDKIDDLSVEKIGIFETHQHTKKRPLYVVSQRH